MFSSSLLLLVRWFGLLVLDYVNWCKGNDYRVYRSVLFLQAYPFRPASRLFNIVKVFHVLNLAFKTEEGEIASLHCLLEASPSPPHSSSFPLWMKYSTVIKFRATGYSNEGNCLIGSKFRKTGLMSNNSQFIEFKFIVPLNIVRVIKSRRLKWVGHVARMEEVRSAFKIFNRQT